MDDVAPSTGPLSNNQATNDNKPTLSGTADANSTVNIYDNGVAVDSVQADGNGNWSWTSSSPLDDGPNAFTVTATNQSGTGECRPHSTLILILCRRLRLTISTSRQMALS